MNRHYFLSGVLAGILAVIAIQAGLSYYAGTKYKTFSFTIANEAFDQNPIRPSDVQNMTDKFEEAIGWSLARSFALKDRSSAVRLGTVLDFYLQADEKKFKELLKDLPANQKQRPDIQL